MSDLDNVVQFKSIDEAIGKFVELRDELTAKKRIWKAEEDADKGELEKIQMWLRDKADELGVDSFTSRLYGTAFRTVKTSYRVVEWGSFIEWIKENNAFHCLEKRCAKLAVKEIHDESGTVPPGLDYIAEVEMDVRRPTKGKGPE